MATHSESIDRVVAALEALGITTDVTELPQSTRTAADAAMAVGCDVGQIAKSIVFRGVITNRTILVIASGINRISETKLAAAVGEQVVKAEAEFVRSQTGFAIGGVAPVAHLKKLDTFLDEDLLRYEHVWAAAGTPHAVIRMSRSDLYCLGATILKITD